MTWSSAGDTVVVMSQPQLRDLWVVDGQETGFDGLGDASDHDHRPRRIGEGIRADQRGIDGLGADDRDDGAAG